MRVKYPRTPHLPWSPGFTSDDLRSRSVAHFEGKEVVVTEKMDGENTSLYSDGCHARSINSNKHSSREWVRSLQGEIGYLLPEGWRLCGENLFARHSIPYEGLDSYFLLFSIWDNNRCLSWDDTVEWSELLGVESVPVLYRGVFDTESIKALSINEGRQEGYVVRLADSFDYEAFGQSVAKWVRPNHVQTDSHWMHSVVTPNKLR